MPRMQEIDAYNLIYYVLVVHSLCTLRMIRGTTNGGTYTIAMAAWQHGSRVRSTLLSVCRAQRADEQIDPVE